MLQNQNHFLLAKFISIDKKSGLFSSVAELLVYL